MSTCPMLMEHTLLNGPSKKFTTVLSWCIIKDTAKRVQWKLLQRYLAERFSKFLTRLTNYRKSKLQNLCEKSIYHYFIIHTDFNCRKNFDIKTPEKSIQTCIQTDNPNYHSTRDVWWRTSDVIIIVMTYDDVRTMTRKQL